MDDDDIRDRLLNSSRILEFECAKLGGWKQLYGGYLDEDDASGPGFVGPLIWSEADLVHRFADHLSHAFRDVESYGRPAVHLGLPIRVGTRSDLVRGANGRRSSTSTSSSPIRRRWAAVPSRRPPGRRSASRSTSLSSR